MTITATAGTLEAPGATLHYEVRGRGPVLVLLPGGTADAAIFADADGTITVMECRDTPAGRPSTTPHGLRARRS